MTKPTEPTTSIPDQLRAIANRIFHDTADANDYEELSEIADALSSVHVLVIEHRHGFDHWVFTSEESVKAQLHWFVTSWWNADGPKEPMPADRDEAIDLYFGFCEDESYTHDEVQVMP